jgi:hypothetical protein
MTLNLLPGCANYDGNYSFEIDKKLSKKRTIGSHFALDMRGYEQHNPRMKRAAVVLRTVLLIAACSGMGAEICQQYQTWTSTDVEPSVGNCGYTAWTIYGYTSTYGPGWVGNAAGSGACTGGYTNCSGQWIPHWYQPAESPSWRYLGRVT